MSWNPEVVADSSGKWCGNGLFFATEKEAKQYVHDLSMRWTSVYDTRVVESTEPVNYTYHNQQLRAVDLAPGEHRITIAVIDPDRGGRLP